MSNSFEGARLQSRALTIRLIRLAMAAALIFPLALFLFASRSSYRSISALADERLLRSLDIQEEEASKDFELVGLIMRRAAELVAGMDADDIRANEERLHDRFGDLANAVASVQSIWVFTPDGHALATSSRHPPPARSFADRDFITGPLRSGGSIYYGRVYPSSFGAEPFFTVSRPLVENGSVVAILEVSVLPSNFFQFYSTLAYAQGLLYALIRSDGTFLARYPKVPLDAPDKLDANTNFHRLIAAHPEGGSYRSFSPIDQVERRYAIRRLEGTPLYLSAGIEEESLRREWMVGMAYHLIFGLPATLLVFAMLFVVLRRTQTLYAEVDARTKAEQALRQSQRLDAIGQLTGGVAHDFNNLLTIILGNLEGLQRQLGDGDAKIKRRIENAIRGGQRAVTLIKRLLAFSRQQPLSPEPIDVNQLMHGLSDFLRRALGEEIELEVVGGGGLWPVETDPAELETALLNLAVNARDAMPAGGKLTIEASNSLLDEAYCRDNADVQPGQYVMISVSDTGSGMTGEVMARAFEPFFTTKQAGQGTGLGLSQVYGFVKQSGGHISIYSEIGEGTTIKIYLRRFYGAVTDNDPIPTAPAAGGNECVLVVEDDDDVRAHIADTLSSLGYRVLQAENGEAALRLLRDHPEIALLLTDVVMPGMNGRQLADAAKSMAARLKVIYMTGYSRNAIVHQGRLDPGVDLIQKPVTADRLAATVRKLLDM
jgi:signal transduction histidine kinase/CheY-like chemotaxis protein